MMKSRFSGTKKQFRPVLDLIHVGKRLSRYPMFQNDPFEKTSISEMMMGRCTKFNFVLRKSTSRDATNSNHKYNNIHT